MKKILNYSPEKSREILKYHLMRLNFVGMVALAVLILIQHNREFVVGNLAFNIFEVISKLTLAGVIVGQVVQLSMKNRRKASTLYHDEDGIVYITIKEGTLLFLSTSIYRTYRIKSIFSVKYKRDKIKIYGEIEVVDTSSDSVKKNNSDYVSIPRCFSELELLIKKRVLE